ncbi:unnamed protein product (mitochondrion) [Plasmodiophora brassicae]|uniref:Uncharacterized protein n=1 Tax=Plasmodiophora brassicae TaxID=37360 RepID=A0A3P3YBM6_PLABS|nr:unnamed protein product [Plasmodiophora brassicae]
MAWRALLLGADADGGISVVSCDAGQPPDAWQRNRLRAGARSPAVTCMDAAETRVVSCDEDTLYVHSVKENEPLYMIQAPGIRCVALAPKSARFVCAGFSNGTVKAWNASSGQLAFTFKDGDDAVRHVAISSDDSYVASARSTGPIAVHSLVHGGVVGELKAKAAVSCLCFSSLRAFVLCATDDAGNVTVYDAKSKRTLAAFPNSHTAPATGAAFSPTNKEFLATCGLDRRIRFYDISKACALHPIVASAPLNTIRFASEGTVVAVTTTKGETIIYDLRSTNAPLLTVKGSFTNILRYVPLPPPEQVQNDIAVKEKNEASTFAATSLFSPVHSASLGRSDIAASRPQLRSVGRPSSGKDSLRTSPSSLFSPVQDRGSLSQRLRFDSSSTPVTARTSVHLDRTDRDEDVPSALPERPDERPPLPAFGKPVADEMDVLSKKVLEQISVENTSYPERRDESPSLSTAAKSAADELEILSKKVLEQISFDNSPGGQGRDASVPKAADGPDRGVAGNLHTEVIRAALDESLADVRDDIRNLHVDMIRQFHIQQVDLARQLASEIEYLRHQLAAERAENTKLRAHIQRFGLPPDRGVAP